MYCTDRTECKIGCAADDRKCERVAGGVNEVARLRKALAEVAALDYANAATNCAAYTAVKIAEDALGPNVEVERPGGGMAAGGSRSNVVLGG